MQSRARARPIMTRRRDYRKIWSDFHGLNVPFGWHIHHMDGDKINNDPANLICVSPHVHWCIHLLQGDSVALKGNWIQNATKAGKAGGVAASKLKISGFFTGAAAKAAALSPYHPNKTGAWRRGIGAISIERRREINQRTWEQGKTGFQTMDFATRSRIGKTHSAHPNNPFRTGVAGRRAYELKVGVHAFSIEQRTARSQRGAAKAFELERLGFQQEGVAARAGSIGGAKSNKIIYVCPHCNFRGASNIMQRWHFDKCRAL